MRAVYFADLGFGLADYACDAPGSFVSLVFTFSSIKISPQFMTKNERPSAEIVDFVRHRFGPVIVQCRGEIMNLFGSLPALPRQLQQAADDRRDSLLRAADLIASQAQLVGFQALLNLEGSWVRQVRLLPEVAVFHAIQTEAQELKSRSVHLRLLQATAARSLPNAELWVNFWVEMEGRLDAVENESDLAQICQSIEKIGPRFDHEFVAAKGSPTGLKVVS